MIQDESIKVVYKGDGVNAVFDYPYALDSESLIICYIYDNQGDELITAGQQFKDGTTTSVERNDKKLTVKVDNKAPTDRYDITLTRTTPTDQLTDLPNVYPYNDIEKSFDKTTLQMQELKDAQSRALKVSEDVNVDVVLPKPKPNSVYAWNDAANKLVSLGLDTTTTAEEFNRLGDDIKNLLAETTQFHDMANEQYQELLAKYSQFHDMPNEQYQELLAKYSQLQAKYSQLQATFDAMYVRQDGTKFMTDSLSIKNPNRYSGINLYDTDGSHLDIENCIDSNNIANIIQFNSIGQPVAKVTIPKRDGNVVLNRDIAFVSGIMPHGGKLPIPQGFSKENMLYFLSLHESMSLFHAVVFEGHYPKFFFKIYCGYDVNTLEVSAYTQFSKPDLYTWDRTPTWEDSKNIYYAGSVQYAGLGIKNVPFI